MSDKKVVDQVKIIVLYGIALNAKRTEFLNMPEHKKHEIDRQDSAQKADDILNSFLNKNSGRNLIPSNSEDSHCDFMAKVQSMDKRLQK